MAGPQATHFCANLPCPRTARVLFLLSETWPRKDGEPWVSFLVCGCPQRRGRCRMPDSVWGQGRGLLKSMNTCVLLLMLFFFFCVILCRVPGTRPIAALCLPLRIFPMRMISARNLARHLQLLETPYPGICLNMRDRKGRSTGARCWTLLRGQSLGSQVRASGKGWSRDESCGN